MAKLSMQVAAVALLGLVATTLHVSQFHHHAHARLAHHRTLQQLQTAPSLRMLFHSKRDTMLFHGHTDFEVLVQPTSAADDTNVFEFNGVATLKDGDYTHTYKLVDGVAYYTKDDASDNETTSTTTSTTSSSTSVVPSSELPPLHELLDALASATPVDAVDTTQTINCPATSKLLHARFADQDFVLCGVQSDEMVGLRAFGEDFDVEIRTSPDAAPLQITKPAEAASAIASAAAAGVSTPPVPRSTTGSTTTGSTMDALKRASADSVSRMLAPRSERRLTLQAATCACKSKPRPCIFFHGMDIKADGGLVDNFDFFGKIKDHAPCCSSVKFAVLNTVDLAWNNASLVDKACGYALSMSPTSDQSAGVIEDTIVVTHSMGNLMLAHAEATGKCQLGSTSSWVALSGPFKGSMGSDFQQQICNGDYFAKDVVAAVVSLFGQCPPSKARAQLTYEGGSFSSAALNAQYVAAQKVHEKRVAAGVCGFSPSGLVSGDSIGLGLGGSILPHKSKDNDGVVEFQSCIANLPASRFNEDWSSTFYRAKLNHADTTFKNGDGWFDKRQKPVKWFECLAL